MCKKEFVVNTEEQSLSPAWSSEVDYLKISRKADRTAQAVLPTTAPTAPVNHYKMMSPLLLQEVSFCPLLHRFLPSPLLHAEWMGILSKKDDLGCMWVVQGAHSRPSTVYIQILLVCFAAWEASWPAVPVSLLRNPWGATALLTKSTVFPIHHADHSQHYLLGQLHTEVLPLLTLVLSLWSFCLSAQPHSWLLPST